MTLKEMVYRAILFQERVASYSFNSDIWYVIKWNKQTYIHYRYASGYGLGKIHWYLCADQIPPKWNCQTQEIDLTKSSIGARQPSPAPAASE